METEPTNPPRSVAPGLVRRRESPEDERFLFRVYASTRADELDLTGWDDATRLAFLEMQFKAMRSGYASQWPKAESSIILLHDQPIGRMVIDWGEEVIWLVDIALLRKHRGQGHGTILMRQWLDQASPLGKPVRLHVLKNTRPVRLYERLGFVKIGDYGMYDRMEWRPQA